ncbi:Kinesin-like_protein [Hexamita inflata]|uniref:Kinesin-like protein n=1 Tax=Hexamita inflata TaxID=28002 RepID=A0AA86Q6Y6_9EUKA|nr:Kinesin-like protein [Hexamita inflata]
MSADILTASQLNSGTSTTGIQVVARIRPSLQHERQLAYPCIFKTNQCVCTTDPQNKLLTSEHPFDAVFGPESTQSEVFSSLQQNIYNALCGVPLLQINYGVTSSGKTYTLFGTEQQPGLLTLSSQFIKQNLPEARLFISVVQIYLNQVSDLLNNCSQLKALATQADPLPGRVFKEFRSETELNQLLKKALSLREQSATNNNSQSSRSHCLIYLVIQHNDGQNQLCFVDLAGSEPFQATQSKICQQESSFIRTSLLMLDKAIRDLKNLSSNNSNSVSFRSSQLTMCLRPFLQPKLVNTKFELPGSISLILNLHSNAEGFYSNKETLNLGLLTKEIKNYAKTPSRLGQLGQSVLQVAKSVRSSMSLNNSMNASQISELDEDYIAIRRQEWDWVQEQFSQLGEQLYKMQEQVEDEIIEARRDTVKEMQELMELELQAQKDEYELELIEKDEEIRKLKTALGL